MNDLNNKMYNSHNEVEIFDNFKYLAEGKKARIYKKGNRVLKYYKPDNKGRYELKKDVFYHLKKVDNPNVVKLYDYYYDSPKYHLISPIAGYTMEYIDDKHINLLDKPKEYVLDMVEQLENTTLTLTDQRIEIFDLHADNIILMNDGFKLIDVDFYSISKLKSYNNLLYKNKMQVLHYLKDKMRRDFKGKGIDVIIYKLDILLSMNLDYKSMRYYINQLFTEDTLYNSLVNKVK